MNVALNDLPVGKWRNLTAAEMKEINDAVEHSTKTEEGSYVDDWDE